MSITLPLWLLSIEITAAICVYIYCFIITIKGIIENFRQNPPQWNGLYWTMAIHLLFSAGFYCLTYFSCLQLKTELHIKDETFTFLTGANDKLFSFLFAAVIAQFLSALFSRQQYEYQKRRDLNLAEADKFEAILALLNKLYISRTMPIRDIISFLLQSPAVRKLSSEQKNQYKELVYQFNKSNLEYITNIQTLQDNMVTLSLTTMLEYIRQHIRIDTLDKLPSCMPDESYLTKLNDITAQKAEIDKYEVKFRKLIALSRPYLIVIRAVLFNIAKSYRVNIIIHHPDKEQLEAFAQDRQKLVNWVADIEHQIKRAT